jgi:hypothetical protein
MITITNNSVYNNAKEVDEDFISQNDFSPEDSFFGDFPNDQYCCNEEERAVLDAAIAQTKERRKLSKRSSTKSKLSDSTYTVATVLSNEFDASQSRSSSTSSKTRSVEPIKRRLSREEEEAFFASQFSGEFNDNDSFESSQDIQSESRFSCDTSKVKSKRSGISRSQSNSHLRGTSLDSVDEGKELRITAKKGSITPSKRISRRPSTVTIATAATELTDDFSVDQTTVTDVKETKKKNLSPVEEAAKAKSRSTKSTRSSTSSKKSSTSKKSSKSRSKSNEHEDDFKTQSTKANRHYDQHSGKLDSKLESGIDVDSANSKCNNHMMPNHLLMNRQVSISNLSTAMSTMSSLSADTGLIYKHQENKSLVKLPRRPSLHSVFDWNKNSSDKNSTEDPPGGEDTLVVNMSSVLKVPRHKKLERSSSASNVLQYNNTPQWPPRKGQVAATGNLHAQFYNRETNLNTPVCVKRTALTTPVVTPQQMLSVLEPVTLRERLTFQGLEHDHQLGNHKAVDYGSILDDESQHEHHC